MPSTFADLGVPTAVADALASRGVVTPFPIQTLAIPAGLDGRDVTGRAPTGSGKTLAFGIPLAARVARTVRARPTRPRALVLAPTRELASQIHDELGPLLAAVMTGTSERRSVASFYGGVSFIPQLKALRRGVDVAVACPGRLADLVRRGNVVLDEVEIVVVDEADRMADMGFLPEVQRILDMVRADRQTLLFSATLDGAVDTLVRRYQHDPQRCDVMPEQSELDRTTHLFLRAKREERVKATAQLVDEHGSAVVFCRTKHGADRVAGQLLRAGIEAVAIHGGRSQPQRERALARFASGKVAALVATDVAARGIHVDDVGCVVHFDVAADHKDYVHRSGRTGRAGARGVVVSLVTDADTKKVREIELAIGRTARPQPGASLQGSAPQERSAPQQRSSARQKSAPRQKSAAPQKTAGQRSGTPQKSGTPQRRAQQQRSWQPRSPRQRARQASGS